MLIVGIEKCHLSYVWSNRIQVTAWFVCNLWNGQFLSLQVREAQLAQFNYILVVGAQEADTGEVHLLLPPYVYTE